jgi:hypothetical protein
MYVFAPVSGIEKPINDTALLPEDLPCKINVI